MLARPGAAAVAGATDLCAAYLEGLMPGTLVALDGVTELRGLRVEGGAIRIGALTTHHEGSTHPALRATLPGFAAAWGMIANPRIRFRGTIGGNLMARRTRYEMSLLLTAAEARLQLVTPAGAISAAPADLWTGSVPAGAVLTAVEIPLRPGARFTYQRRLRPQLTLAVQRHAAGGRAAIGTEWLRPVPLSIDDAALDSLPPDFADPVISHWYARRAGAALLRRGLEELDAG